MQNIEFLALYIRELWTFYLNKTLWSVVVIIVYSVSLDDCTVQSTFVQAYSLEKHKDFSLEIMDQQLLIDVIRN